MSLHRPPRLLTCFTQLALIDACTRILGLRRTLVRLQRVAGTSATDYDEALIAETTRRLLFAAALYPRRARCLEQSLALYVLLRRRGVTAEFKLGVRPLPFFAHAWVEVAGRAIAENDSVRPNLATISSLPV